VLHHGKGVLLVEITMSHDPEIPRNSDKVNAAYSLEGKGVTCPLFMEGLPTDFSSNPALAALASLLDSDEEKERKKEERKIASKAKAGGGKVVSVKTRSYRAEAPYNARDGSEKQKDKEASVGEAQLFLGMWKIE
jgi:hypothetical protein